MCSTGKLYWCWYGTSDFFFIDPKLEFLEHIQKTQQYIIRNVNVLLSIWRTDWTSFKSVNINVGLCARENEGFLLPYKLAVEEHQYRTRRVSFLFVFCFQNWPKRTWQTAMLPSSLPFLQLRILHYYVRTLHCTSSLGNFVAEMQK